MASSQIPPGNLLVCAKIAPDVMLAESTHPNSQQGQTEDEEKSLDGMVSPA